MQGIFKVENPTNGGLDINKGGYVCHHLLENPDDYDVFRQFTGISTAYNLLCNLCVKDLERLVDVLRKASDEQFEDHDSFCEEFVGLPEVFKRQSNLRFAHKIIDLQSSLDASILSIQPQYELAGSVWIAILSSAKIIQVDLSKGTIQHLGDIPSTALTLSENVALHLAPDNRFVAVVNDRESLGVVFDLVTKHITMKLDRGSYHPEQTPFPIAFFQSEGRTLLIHGTDWNRLDISDPQTGELITARIFPPRKEGQSREHYLNYFHALPVISPTREWVAEDGWVWHPFGVTRLWSLRRWLNDNVWESEDGTSLSYLTRRGYHWNTPLFWIDNSTIAVWGFGDYDEYMIPAIQFFDAPTGKRLRWFAGPKEGGLYFDEYLFSTSTEGTEVWDIATGERLLHDPDLIPIRYHHETGQFLSLLPDDRFKLSRLKE